MEFAIVAAPMFLTLFACLEVSRLFMINSLAEDAVFESLRHIMVAGARKEEGTRVATDVLALMGTKGATVKVTPKKNGAVQGEIDDETTSVHVEVTVPMSKNAFLLSSFTKNVNLHSEAEIPTEQYKGFYDGVSS